MTSDTPNNHTEFIVACHKYLNGTWLGRMTDNLYIQPLKSQGAFSDTCPNGFVLAGSFHEVTSTWKKMDLEFDIFDHEIHISGDLHSKPLPCSVKNATTEKALVTICESMYQDPNTGSIAVWLDKPLQKTQYEVILKDTPILGRDAWITPLMVQNLQNQLDYGFASTWIYDAENMQGLFKISHNAVDIAVFNEPETLEEKNKEEDKLHMVIPFLRPEHEILEILVKVPIVEKKVSARGATPGYVEKAPWRENHVFMHAIESSIQSEYRNKMKNVDSSAWSPHMNNVAIEFTNPAVVDDHYAVYKCKYHLPEDTPLNESIVNNVIQKVCEANPDIVLLENHHLLPLSIIAKAEQWNESLSHYHRRQFNNQDVKHGDSEQNSAISVLCDDLLSQGWGDKDGIHKTVSRLSLINLKNNDDLTIENLCKLHQSIMVLKAIDDHAKKLPIIDASPMDLNKNEFNSPTLKI